MTSRVGRFVVTVVVCSQAVMASQSLATTSGENDTLSALISRIPDVRQVVDQAVGGSTQAKADSKAFVKALTRYAKEANRYQKNYRKILAEIRSVQLSSFKKSRKRVRLTQGFRSYKIVVRELNGAHLTLYGPNGMAPPLDGGRDVSASLDALGTLLGAKGVEALYRGRWKEAQAWFVRQVKFGGLVAGSARTHQGLVAGVSQVHIGLGLLVVHARNAQKTPNQKEIRRLRSLRKQTGQMIRSLDRIFKAQRQVTWLDAWYEAAKGNPSPIWRYEGIKALGRYAATSQVADIRKRAVERLKLLAKLDSQVGRAANRVLNGWLKRVLATQ